MTPRYPRPHVVLFCLCFALVVLGATAQTPAQNVSADAALFDDTTLHDLQLFINSRDLQLLRAHFQENTYYPADLQWRNIRVRNVAVRSRGTATRNPVKLGLRIDFDRYTTGQRFLGLQALVLDNLWQDPGMIRERVAMAFFGRVNVPAPRESFCRLYINHVFQGLYTIVEEIDAGFLSRATGEDGGYLFEYQWDRPYYGEYLGDELDPYKALFEAKTHEREADTILYSPIRDLFREVNGPDDAVWRSRVEEFVDLQQFLTLAAAENFLSEEDGVLGDTGMDNFYLYRPAASNRHRFIPWDKDRTFEKIDTPIFQRAEENILFRRAMAFDDLRSAYLETLERCARAAADENWLEREIVASSTLVTPTAYEDLRKPFANSEYDAAIEFFIQFARQRSAFVLDALGRPREDPGGRIGASDGMMKIRK